MLLSRKTENAFIFSRLNIPFHHSKLHPMCKKREMVKITYLPEKKREDKIN